MLRTAAATALVIFGVAVTAQSCDMPSGFSVQEWQSWEPTDELDESGFMMFTFEDEDTGTYSPCYWDAYTPPVNENATVKAFQCDNPIVEFTYEEGILSMSETICVDSTGKGLFKVTGKMKPNVECEDAGDQGGYGQLCVSMEPTKSTFTSFEPIGIDFPTGPISTIKPGGP